MQHNRELHLMKGGSAIRRLSLAFALALVVAAAQPAAGATVIVVAERDGDTIAVHASAVLNADATIAWHVLTEYDRYTEFIPDLRVSRVVARQGAKVTVEQSGDAAVWLFKIPLDVTFEINAIPPNGLQSRAVGGSVRAPVSSYALTPAVSGVRLDYAGRVVPRFELFGHIEQIAVEQNISRQFQALADEIERRSAVLPEHTTADAH